MLYLYSMDCFIFSTLNKASQFGDDSKVKNMGAYAVGLNECVEGAACNRKDIDPSKYENCIVWRGTGMTEAEISQFDQLAAGLLEWEEVQWVYKKKGGFAGFCCG